MVYNEHGLNGAMRDRRSIRLKGYDYAGTGAYFVTLCTWNRECLFGNFEDGEMNLNGLGVIVQEEWLRTAELRKAVETDAFVIMPNHIHGIVVITGGGDRSTCIPEEDIMLNASPGRPGVSWESPSLSLGSIVRGFKSATKIRVNEARGSPRAAVWQRNYHEHVIRGELDLERVRRYIAENPSRWTEDDNHPSRMKHVGYPGVWYGTCDR